MPPDTLLAPATDSSTDRTDHSAAFARDILVRSLGLGAFADLTLRTLPGGLGWSLFVLALGGVAFDLARRKNAGVSIEQVAWLTTAIACAAMFSWRDAEALRPANILGTLVAIAMFAMTTDGRPATSILVARIRDVITGGAYTVLDLIAGAPVLAASEAKLSTLPALRGGRSWTAIRAALLTIPLVLVFGALLSSADPAFASLVDLRLDLGRVIPHIVLAGVFTWLAAGWLRGALLRMTDRPTLPDRLPVRLGLTEVTAALGAVATLFAVFVALQLRWLFGGATVVLATSGLTVAEYARRGFFELVAVAALVVPLVLVTGALIDEERVLRRHRLLSLTMLGLLGAIILSAFMRLQLYVGQFGLSSDRLYAAVLMTWIAVVCAAMAATVLRGTPRRFAAITMASGFSALVGLNVANPDLLVARVNLANPTSERGVDLPYLARLGGDAVAPLAAALLAAPASAGACEAAKLVRGTWLANDEPPWNLGARRGRAATVARVTDAEVARLCTTGQPDSAGP